MKIAVIGAGYWGANLVRVFNQLGVLDRVCDLSAERLSIWPYNIQISRWKARWKRFGTTLQ